MSPSLAQALTASCACGRVALEASGRPIACAVCYCDDCQAGSRAIEALPGAGPVLEPDGGTAYVLYRKDRVRCTRGAELLQPTKLRPGSATSRVVATCCNTAMLVTFDDAKHWVDVYRARVAGAPPPLEMRVCTRFRPAGSELPGDVPAYARFPLAFIGRLLAARLAMLLGR